MLIIIINSYTTLVYICNLFSLTFLSYSSRCRISDDIRTSLWASCLASFDNILLATTAFSSPFMAISTFTFCQRHYKTTHLSLSLTYFPVSKFPQNSLGFMLYYITCTSVFFISDLTKSGPSYL